MPQAAHTFDTPDLPNVTAQPGRPRTRSDTHTSPAGETVPHHECTAECRLLPSGSRGWLGAVARCPPDVRKVWKLQIPSTVHTVNTLKNHTLNHLRSGAICTAIYWIFKKMSHKLQFPGESKVGGNVTEKQWSPLPRARPAVGTPGPGSCPAARGQGLNQQQSGPRLLLQQKRKNREVERRLNTMCRTLRTVLGSVAPMTIVWGMLTALKQDRGAEG